MILVVGEALVDLVISPDGTVEAALGGGPFNTARAIGRLGHPVEFGGVLSEDRFGSMLRSQLAADGVGVDRSPGSDRPTTLAAAELDDGGGARYRFYADGTSAPSLTDGNAVPPDATTDVLFTGGLGLLLEPMADTVAGLVQSAPMSTTVAVDVNCRPRVIPDRAAYVDRLERVLSRADVVKVSDEDIDYLFPGASSDEAATRLLGRGPAAVVVTGGSGATVVVNAAGWRRVDVAPLDAPVVDTIGAGDTFGAGMLVAWVEGGGRRETLRTGDGAGMLDTLARAVSAGHAAAAVVVTRRGADPPWRSELPATWPA